MTIRIDRKAIIAAMAVTGALAQPAAAQEKPACPTGVYGDWTYQVKVDTIRLEQREAPVVWNMADGAEETTHGYAVNYYWSDPYEGQRQRLMDGESNLQVGLYILHPPQRDIRYNMVAFSRNAEHERHDLDEVDRDDEAAARPHALEGRDHVALGIEIGPDRVPGHPARRLEALPLGDEARQKLLHHPTVTREPFMHQGRIPQLLSDGVIAKDLGIPPLNPAEDRVMICGSPEMLRDLKALCEKRGFKEGNTSTPGDFVIERAFVG